MTAAPSGTPLAQKLGIVRGMRVWFHDMPADIRAALEPDAIGAEEQAAASDGLQCAVLFVTERARLERQLKAVAPLLQSKGFVWAAWPRAAGAELDEDAVRDVARPLGLTETQSCTINGDWNALKFVLQRALG
ncbi:DUF3052 family protein [Sphingosinithalassobacter sp. CS137]|uniref:DUF3052 family protein n=1 Tax=Sphingosinithalassobacter sp. CS137 TaxID=2762748 RepID=UPI00165E6FF5|nr:DUF3052 family protein [Sphingosinithalassobacter sp. CS137]